MTEERSNSSLSAPFLPSLSDAGRDAFAEEDTSLDESAHALETGEIVAERPVSGVAGEEITEWSFVATTFIPPEPQLESWDATEPTAADDPFQSRARRESSAGAVRIRTEEIEALSEDEFALLESRTTQDVEVLGALLVDSDRASYRPLVNDPSESAERSPREDRVRDLEVLIADAAARDDLNAQISLVEELHTVFRQSGREDLAFEARMRLADLDPSEHRVLGLLDGSDPRRLGRVAGLYDRVQDRIGTDTKIAIGLRLSELELGLADPPDLCVTRLQHLRTLAPEHVFLFERWLEAVSRVSGVPALVRTLRDEARRLRVAERAAALLVRAARLCEDSGDLGTAADLYLEATDRVPEQRELHAEAERLLAATGRDRTLAELLEARLYRVSGSERGNLRRRAAELYFRLGDVVAAERLLRAAVEEDPLDAASLTTLIDLLEGRGAGEDLLVALLGALDRVRGDPSSLHRQIARVAERLLGRPELAVEHWREVLRRHPDDLEVLNEIESACRRRSDWAGLLHALTWRAQRVDDRNVEARALCEVAEVYAERFGDYTRAKESYRRALERVPSAVDALDGLARLAELEGDYSQAIELLHDLALTAAEDARATVHLRIGRIFEQHLGQLDEAALEYEVAREADPSQREVLTRLRIVRQAQGNHREALELAVLEAEYAETPEAQIELWERAGALARERVVDLDRAAECFQRALELDGERHRARAGLAEVHWQRGAFAEAAPLFVAAAEGELEHDLLEAVDLLLRAAEAHDRLGDDEDALALYERVLLLTPKARRALERVAELAEPRGLWERAHDASASLVLHHEHALGPALRANCFLRMARAKHALGDIEAAIRLAARAETLDPDATEPVRFLADLLRKNGQRAEAAFALERLVAKVTDEEALPALQLEAAEWLLEALELSRAQRRVQTLLALRPEHTAAARLAARIELALGDPKSAAEALLAAAERSAEAELWIEAARSFAGPARDRERAKACYRAAQEIDAAQPGLADFRTLLDFDQDYDALLRAHEAAGFAARHLAPERAFEHFEAALALARDQLDAPEQALRFVDELEAIHPELAWVALERARLVEEAARQAEAPEEGRREALALWSELVQRYPGHLEALRRLIALFIELGQPRNAQVYAEVLVTLEEAGPLEERFLGGSGERYNPAPPTGVEGAAVAPHPAETSGFGPIFAELGLSPLLACADAIPEPKLRRRDRVDVQALGTHVAGPLLDACAILGQPLPLVHVRDDAPAAVGPGFEGGAGVLVVSLALAVKEPEAALRFQIGRALSLLRPRSLALSLLPLDVLREALEGLARERLPERHWLADPRRAKKRGKSLERELAAERRGPLAERISALLMEEPRRSLELDRDAVFRSADRSGMVTCGSLLVAAGALAQGGPRDARWFVPLVEYACSRDFAEIVGRIG